MKTPRESRNRPLPASQPCVWMSAGLLAFHLCDRDYDCESCPLDAALRRSDCHGAATRPREAAAGKSEPPAPATLSFPGDRRYGRGHGWLKPRSGRRLRLGLDAFAAALLAPARGVVFPALGRELQAGEVLCWVRTGAGPVPVRTAVPGRLTRCNLRVRIDPSLLAAEPYAGGWLAELTTGEQAGLPPDLLDAAAAREQALADGRRVAEALAGASGRPQPVGATLQDGGEPVADLRRILGEGPWLKLALSLLRAP